MKLWLTLILALIPGVALANDPPDGFFLVLGIALIVGLFIIEAFVVILEAVVYNLVLGVKFKSSVAMSVTANLASLVTGGILYTIGISRWFNNNFLVQLFPTVVTIALEVPVVLYWVGRARLKTTDSEGVAFLADDRKVLWTALMINLVTNLPLQFVVLRYTH